MQLGRQKLNQLTERLDCLVCISFTQQPSHWGLDAHMTVTAFNFPHEISDKILKIRCCVGRSLKSWLMWHVCNVFTEWVDAVWELEFTESKPLPGEIEEELAASGDEAFRKLYRCLLPYTVEQHPSADKDETSQVKLIQHRFKSCKTNSTDIQTQSPPQCISLFPVW